MSDAAEAAVAAPEAAPAVDTTAAPANDNATDYGGDGLSEALEATAAPEAWSVDALPENVAGQMVEMSINGEMVRLPLIEALKGTQKFKAATKKEMAAAASVKAAEERVQSLLNDPLLLAKEGGPEMLERAISTWTNSDDPQVQAALERAYTRLVQDSNMTPEQKAAAEADRALQAREAKVREWEEQQQTAAQQAAAERATEDYRTRITAALEAKGIPPTLHAISRAAMAISGALENGVDMDPADAVDLIHDERRGEYGAELGALDGDDLLTYLGPDIVRKINQATIARTGRVKAAKPPPSAPAANDNGREVMGSQEFRKKHGMGSGSW